MKKKFQQKNMSAEPLLPDKRPTAGKLTFVVVIFLVFFLGSVLALVFGSTTPNVTAAQNTQRNTLIAVGSIVLILTVAGFIAYLSMTLKPESQFGRAVSDWSNYQF